MQNIVIAGGGPVGLIMANLLSQIYGEETTIWILEKRAEATRKQILLLTPKTLEALPIPVTLKLFGADNPGCYILPPTKDRWGRCYKSRTPLASIRTSILEKELEKYLKSLPNVKIIRPIKSIKYNNKTSSVNVDGKTIKYDILIGADGANSQVRTDVLDATFRKNRFIARQKPMYGAVFNFDNAPLAPATDKLSKTRAKMVADRSPQHQHRYFRGQLNGIYYVGLKVNKNEFLQIVDKKTLPKSVKQRLNDVCKAATPVGVGCHFDHLSSMSAFQISPQIASKFMKLRPKPVFLIGDAAITTHYFSGSGLNVGVEGVILLSDMLSKNPDGRISVEKYKKNMSNLVKYTADVVNVVGVD